MQKIIAILLALLCLALPAFAEEAETAEVLQVHSLMLGCADGFLIRLGDVEILVDGGNALPQAPTDDVVNYLRDVGVDTLDVIIITHWHLDHCMNLNEVLTEFGRDDTVIYSPADRVPDEIDNGTVVVKVGPLVKGTHQQMKMGDVLTYGDMVITCIGPERLSQNGGANVDSLNFVLQYGERRFLFTGDYAQSGSINGEYKELCANVDVLKFPHHAIEPYEIGNNAMRVVRPEWVLVSGATSTSKIWKFAGDLGVNVPRDRVLTNGNGNIVFLTDGGERFEILTQVQPAEFAANY